MATAPQDPIDSSGLAKIDQQLAALEENISRLKASLRHWETWEIDYEGLREEFAKLDDNCTDEEFLASAKDFNAEALDEKEIKSLVQTSGSSRRRKSQLLDRLAKRIDYVVRNANSIRTQLSNAQKKRNALLLAESSEHRDNAILPLTEITEEIDNDDRIVSSSIKTPKSAAPGLAEVLRKAGVEDIEVLDGVVTSGTNQPRAEQQTQDGARMGARTNASKFDGAEASRIDETAIGVQNTSPQTSDSEVGSDGDSKVSSPVLPSSESPEDALLRREMLEYTPDEAGAVVAQLEIDADSADNDSDISIHDLMDEDDLQLDDSEDSDAFDENGRSLKNPITEEYRQEMIALERKLNAKGMQNLGPSPSNFPERVGTAIDEPTPSNAKTLRPGSTEARVKKSSKRVAFAKDLDIAPTSVDQSKAQKSNSQPASPAVSNTVSERGKQTSTPRPPIPGGNDSRISRFKASRSPSTQSSYSPNASAKSSRDDWATPNSTLCDKLQSDIVVERPSHSSKSAHKPPNGDEIDTALHRKEVAGEFYRMRNRMIQRQEGFTEQPDSQEEIAMHDGTGRKVSRFKAARIK